jgi:hypothetical protein
MSMFATMRRNVVRSSSTSEIMFGRRRTLARTGRSILAPSWPLQDFHTRKEKRVRIGRRQRRDRSITEEIGGGVPQGSVLGPTLWNVLYDDVMEIEVPEGVSLVCCSDDLAIVVTASTKEDMILEGNETLHRTKLWMAANNLTIAEEKTVVTILNKKWKVEEISFSLGNRRINPAPWVKYLGVTLDRGLRFGRHIKEMTERPRKLLRLDPTKRT